MKTADTSVHKVTLPEAMAIYDATVVNDVFATFGNDIGDRGTQMLLYLRSNYYEKVYYHMETAVSGLFEGMGEVVEC